MNVAFFENEFDFEKGSGWEQWIWKINKTSSGHLCNNISASYIGNKQDRMPQNKNNYW